jgi:hypothetical protein
VSNNVVILQAGRYENPEENPFFPENLVSSLVPSYPFTKVKFIKTDIILQFPQLIQLGIKTTYFKIDCICRFCILEPL